MNRHGRASAIAAVLLLAIGLGTWWFLANHRRVERSVDLPPRGEAGYNRLYGLKLALRAAGVRAQSRQRLELAAMRLRPGDTVVLSGDASTLPPQDLRALMAFVRGGGRLVLGMPRPPLFQRDQPTDTPASVNIGVFDALVLKPLGVQRGPPGDCLRVVQQGDFVYFCGSPRLRLPGRAQPALRVRDGKGQDVVLRLPLGAGWVTLAADLNALDNDELDEPPAATLAWRMLEPGPGTVHLVYRAEMPPLWKLVLERGWPVWLPLLLALLAGLWAASQRYGSLLPAPATGRRSLLEHLQAAGEHSHRYGRGHLLYQQARDAFHDRLRRRDPYAAALAGDAQIEAIASRSGWPVADVRRALQAPRPFDPKDLQQRITRLVQLRAKL